MTYLFQIQSEDVVWIEIKSGSDNFKQLVADLKVVPTSDRDYDPDDHVWTIRNYKRYFRYITGLEDAYKQWRRQGRMFNDELEVEPHFISEEDTLSDLGF